MSRLVSYELAGVFTMGMLGNAILSYAQPLIDTTDGSLEDVRRAMSIAQICWNLALLPEANRETAILEMRSTFDLSDESFADFRATIIEPMIQRHQEMFPVMHDRVSNTIEPFSPEELLPCPEPELRTPGSRVGRNDPCPCGSGRKFKKCCGP